ncbi:MAG: HK97 family phage prohead protease [Methylobacterium sp.]|nr:HK97 family phage prohead protease [Methylobacterium sp.]
MNAHVQPPGALPMQTRAAPINVGSINAEARTVDVVFSTGASVRRQRWVGWDSVVPFDEILTISRDAIDMTRLDAGAPALDSHSNYTTRSQVGVIERAWVADGQALATIRFPPAGIDENADRMFGLVSSGIIRNVSVGYTIDEARVVEAEKRGEIEKRIVTRWTPMEISFVTIPADAGAQVRAAVEQATYPFVFNRAAAPISKESDMPDNENRAAAEETVDNIETRNAQAPAQPDLRAERQRAAEITRLANEHSIDAARVAQAIDSGERLEDFRAVVLDQLAQRQRAASHVRVEQDETQTRFLGMQEAVIRGMGFGTGEVSERARPYMDLSLTALAAERLGERRVPESFGARQQLIERAMHSTSDFQILLEGALNTSIGQRYQRLNPTYREWSVREDFNDFRPHVTVTAGDFPMLQRVGEGGEIKFGTVGEKKEQVAVAAYARGLSFSRQLLVNDRLSALGRVLADYGQTIALLEESVAYGVLGLASGDGPTLLEGNAAMFTTGRTNRAATATAINEAGVSAGRAAMRKYAGVDGTPLLGNAPAFILCSPDKETEAQKFVTSITANQTLNVNIFSSLRVVVGNLLSGNGWWLFMDPSVQANFRYGLLDGFTAPRVRMDEPFGVQGMRVTVEHDFGFGGIDWRGGYRNAGA